VELPDAKFDLMMGLLRQNGENFVARARRDEFIKLRAAKVVPSLASAARGRAGEGPMRTVTVYTDYKSPYAYLAKDLIYDMAEACGVRLDWLPYTLDIPSYLGSATLDGEGRVVASQRDPHQWRKVRYAYLDCRRQANRRGLTILGTRKIWDSSLASIGLLWAKQQGDGVLRAYSDRVFERFWRRELDIENAVVVAAMLAEAGADTTGFTDYLAGAGRTEHDHVRAAAEDAGVFGVPSLVLDGELYWGGERIDDVRERLLQGD
jgi:2-hydroxychromene-2-carboxylate isomerase